MKTMEEKYLNFDGMPSSVANDMPWSDTVWSNQVGRVTEDEAVRVSEIYGTALNAAGDSSITLDHHDSRLGPNMVLELPDSDTMGRMPDSDVWSNHPGFLGWTWSSKKREAEREAAEQSKVNAAYTNTGSCAVLTSSLDKLDKSISGLEASKDKGGKGAKRVNARARKTRKIRRPSVASGKEAACEGEAVTQQQQATQFSAMLQAPEAQSKSAISPTMLLLGAVVIGGAIWGISKLMKPKTV